MLALGADAVVELRADEDEEELAARLLAAAGPVDVVLDGRVRAPLQAALRVCAPRAGSSTSATSAGLTAQVPAGLLRGKQLTLSGFAGLHTPLREKRTALTLAVDRPRPRRAAGRDPPFSLDEVAVSVAGKQARLTPRQVRRAARQRDRP